MIRTATNEAPPKAPGSFRGINDDVYSTHTLYQGDCLEILPSMASASVDVVLTDLPYGTTKCAWDNIIPLKLMWAGLKRVGKPGCAFVFTAQQPFTWALAASNPQDFRYELVWEKPNGTSPFNAKRQPMKKHENVLVFCERQTIYNPQMEEGTPYRWNSKRTKGVAGGNNKLADQPLENPGVRYPGSVLRFKQERGLHPTQKPVALMEWLIRTYSNPGDRVLDFTMGSGTTGLAALRTGRSFVGIEQDGDYFDIACHRLEQFDCGEAAND